MPQIAKKRFRKTEVSALNGFLAKLWNDFPRSVYMHLKIATCGLGGGGSPVVRESLISMPVTLDLIPNSEANRATKGKNSNRRKRRRYCSPSQPSATTKHPHLSHVNLLKLSKL